MTRGTTPATPRGARARAGVLALAVTALAGWAVWDSVPVFRADQVGTRVRTDVQRWGDGAAPWTLEQWQGAKGAVEQAIAWTPNDASLHELLSALYALRGTREWGDGNPATSPGVALYRQALNHQERALQLRPLNAMAWAQMALLHYAVGEDANAMWAAWRQAHKLGPNEADVRFQLTEVARQGWWAVPADVRQAVDGWAPGSAAKLDAELASATAAASAVVPGAEAAPSASR